MEILEKTTEACFDDLFDFTLDDGEAGKEDVNPTILKSGATALVPSSSLKSSNPTVSSVLGTHTGTFPELVEEELEWISNKDAFPTVETCFGILTDNPELIPNHESPVSVLENNSAIITNVPTNYPVRARNKRRTSSPKDLFPNKHPIGPGHMLAIKHDDLFSPPPVTDSGGEIGGRRRCLHCQVDKTPQWRAGPMGPKTLCNACGVRYKSGRLLPEYRPANSPTFSSVLHSNSHRKVVEMRKKKLMGVEMGASSDIG